MANGIIIIDKPSGWTSMDVCAKLRGILHTKKVGHAGTLDPMATGVLPVFVGQATRAVSFAESGQKEYVAGLKLGLVTNTQEALLYQQYSIYRLRDKTLVRHPWYLYDLTQSALDVSDADMLRYFGSEKSVLIEVPAESWETYKAANQ